MSDSPNTSEKIVGIEAGSTSFRAVCLDREGNLIVSHTTRVDRSKEVFPQLTEFIGNIKELFGGFDRVGIAVPGLINRESKRIAYSAHIPEHAGIDLLSDISSQTGLKVTMENDANAAAYAEFKMGAGRGSRNLFYVTLGPGVGGAFIFDGNIWHGTSGFCRRIRIRSDKFRRDAAGRRGFRCKYRPPYEKPLSPGQHVFTQ